MYMERHDILTACIHNNHNNYVDNFIHTVEHSSWISAENKSNVSIPSIIADLVAR